MVLLRPAGRPEIRVKVELARTPEESTRGLMYREKLAPDAGMLFLFREEVDARAFWMKNTLIPLDIIFITHDKRVLGIVENAEPLTLDQRKVPGRSQFVLEVIGGWSSAHGVGPGTVVEFLNVE